MLVNLLNPINTNLDTLIYLHELGDLAKSNLEIYFSAILSRMPLAEANLVNHLPTFLSWIPLAEANLAIHFPAILSRMPLKANCIHQKNFKLYQIGGKIMHLLRLSRDLP